MYASRGRRDCCAKLAFKIMPRDGPPPLLASQRTELRNVPLTVEALRAFFAPPKLNDNNLAAVLRVASKLIGGEGIAHKAKPGETFRAGLPVRLDQDLHGLRIEAAKWLPYQKSLGEGCLDKGHGWALNHPIVKLIEFQNAVIENVSLAYIGGAGGSAAPAATTASPASTSAASPPLRATPAASPSVCATPPRSGAAVARAPQLQAPQLQERETIELGDDDEAPHTQRLAPHTRIYKESVLGQLVEILFDGSATNGRWYSGQITKYKVELSKTGEREYTHYVVFADGDKIWYDLAEEEANGELRWPRCGREGGGQFLVRGAPRTGCTPM